MPVEQVESDAPEAAAEETQAVHDIPSQEAAGAPASPPDGVPETAASASTAANGDQLAALKAEVDKNQQGWQRALADFQNFKRRVERDQKDFQQRTLSDVLSRVLPLLDDFDLALVNLPAELQGHPWVNGVSLIQGKFRKLLEEHEVAEIDPVGQAFDPNRHEAIGRDEDAGDVPSGHVTATLQKGYALGDRVLRPARVRVAG
jgi:molecular chaperone GrpE